MNSYGLPWRSCLPEILQQPVMKIRPLVVCGWLVGWSLTSLFSTNTAISEMKVVFEKTLVMQVARG